jgi:hypothetical protein
MPNADLDTNTKIGLLKPSMFHVEITMGQELTILFSDEQIERMLTKIREVGVPMTQDQMVGLARGTFKYPSDTYNVAELRAHQDEELRDQLNYRWMRAAGERIHESRELAWKLAEKVEYNLRIKAYGVPCCESTFKTIGNAVAHEDIHSRQQGCES